MKRQFNGERTVFTAAHVGTTAYPYGKKKQNQKPKKVGLLPYPKIDVNIKSKTITLLEENMEEIFVTQG